MTEFPLDKPGRQMLFTTVRSEHKVGDQVSTGTCFIIDGNVTPNESGLVQPILITNKHVKDFAEVGRYRFFKSVDGKPELGSSIHLEIQRNEWVDHPNPEVDIAATLLGPKINIANSAGTPIYTMSISRDLLPSEEVLQDLDAFEPIIVIGYPDGISDASNLTPVGRKGITATPINLNFNGNPSFLIDASIFPGSSGSPVMIYQEHGYVQRDSYQLGSRRMLLAGIVSSVHYRATEVEQVSELTNRNYVRQFLDLGVVFNFRAINETIDALLNTLPTND